MLKQNKKIVLAILLAAACIVFALTFMIQRAAAPNTERVDPQAQKQEEAKPDDQFDKNRNSLSDPSSLWVVVNKSRPIPLDYRPGDLVTPEVSLNSQKTSEENMLRKEAAIAVKDMFLDAKSEGYSLFIGSGFRSSDLQASYYNGYVARDGQAAADKYSARPGTSEHQTGWALDIARQDRECYLEICFGDLPEGAWLAENAHNYGFVLTYKKGKEHITGYQYEPWHFRFVGKDLAKQIKSKNQTLEEFFNLN